jgi:glutaredoxin
MSMGGLTGIRLLRSVPTDARLDVSAVDYTPFTHINQGAEEPMRTLLILTILGLGVYKAYEYLYNPATAAYDEAGNPNTLVFTLNGCAPCESAVKLLAERHIDYTVHNISTDTASTNLMKAYGGGRQFPFIVTGNRTQAGFEQDSLVGMLAEVHGPEILTSTERRLMRHNFDETGLPRVVMYMTERCGYCKQAKAYLQQKGIDVFERDIDKNASAKRDFDLLKGGGTPLIYVGFRRVPGFNKNRLNKALEVL